MNLRIGFVGGGNMGEAMMAAMIRTGTLSAHDIVVAEMDPARRQWLSDTHGVWTTADATTIPGDVDIVFLAVKPQSLDVLLEQLGPLLTARHLVVSIAAGKVLSYFLDRIETRRLVRAMPNLPALVGEGVTAYCAAEETPEEDLETAVTLLSSFGRVVALEEQSFDAVTALAGSGPAFFAYVAEMMALGGMELGLEREAAALLTEQTMLGTAKLLLEGDRSALELVDAVSSKGGTTLAGMEILRPSGVGRILIETLLAAAERSRELSG